MLGFVPGFCYMGRVDATHRRASTSRAARASAGWLGRHRRRADRRVSDFDAGRLAVDRAHRRRSMFDADRTPPSSAATGRARAVRSRRDRDMTTRRHPRAAPGTADDGAGSWAVGPSGDGRSGRRADGHVFAPPRQPARRQRRRRCGPRDHAARSRARVRLRTHDGDLRRRIRRNLQRTGRCPSGCRSTCRAGARLQFGRRRAGARAYLAIAGGAADAAACSAAARRTWSARWAA